MKPGTSKQIWRPKKKKPQKPKKETRNWLELPHDVTVQIFLKVGVIDILFNVQSVCSAWRKLAREPQLYRRIDMWNPWNYFDPCDFTPIVNMAIEAINRSCGQLVDFSIDYFGTDEIIHHILNTSNSLKCLRLASCYQVSDHTLINALKKLPLLEEFALCHCSFSTEVIEVAGQSCPRLKYFRLNQRAVKFLGNVTFPDSNDEAFAIAANMPQLNRLHLFGNDMTNNGLQALLDGCPHLEYLDLRQCFRIDLKGDILKECKGIKILKLPDDSTDGYEFDATIEHDDIDVYASESDFSYEDYDDYMYGLLELDLSDYEDYGFGGIEGINYEDF